MKNVDAVGQLPRNIDQVKYQLKKLQNKENDPIYSITSSMRTESESREGERSIRTYTLDDQSLKVLLFMNHQIDEIINFCCNSDVKISKK